MNRGVATSPHPKPGWNQEKIGGGVLPPGGVGTALATMRQCHRSKQIESATRVEVVAHVIGPTLSPTAHYRPRSPYGLSLDNIALYHFRVLHGEIEPDTGSVVGTILHSPMPKAYHACSARRHSQSESADHIHQQITCRLLSHIQLGVAVTLSGVVSIQIGTPYQFVILHSSGIPAGSNLSRGAEFRI
jgi:hypothetical protein